ncbi:MAG: HEAT repeat domain-containing protein [Polyangiales bacterium]
MRRTSGTLTALLLTAAASTALAQPRPGARPAARPGAPAAAQGNGPAARVIPLRDAVQLLQSANGDEVSNGLDALVRIGTPDVIPPMVDLIHRGVDDATLENVVEKLGIVGRPEAIDELSSLLHHRRAGVREKAVTALSHIRDNRVRPLLESGLRDSAPAVRAAAARSLGETGARQSVELLQRAFERNVPEAAEALGRLGSVAVAERMLEAVGRSPLGILLPGFRRFLDRRDIADPAKLHIVEQLVARSPTGEVKRFLQQWVDSLPPTVRTPSRTRAMLAIQQIESTGSRPATTPSPAPAGGAQ